MDREKLIKRLMATFLEELGEHVASLNRDLLGLEKAATAEERGERLKTLFRTAHSLKGAARSVSVTVLEEACHRLEEILQAVRDRSLALSAELFALLFATADAIEEASMRLREQQSLAGSPLAALLPRLEAAASGTLPAQPHPQAPAGGEDPPPPAPPPTEVAPPAPAVEAPFEAPGGATVRVPAEKLDAFLGRNGELLVARRRVQSRADDLATLREFVGRWKTEWRGIEKTLERFLEDRQGGGAGQLPRRAAAALGRVGGNLRQVDKELDRIGTAMVADGRVLKEAAGSLDAEVRRVRMLPFAEACQGLERTVRDLAQAAGKEVELVIQGGDVELDRSVLEGLKDPLRHLVRNAVDHGGETPPQRCAAGKPPRMRLTVAASMRGAQVEVVVQDDGRGLDLLALKEQARKRGLPESADERELARLIFLPGLSTSPIITDVSGRGVGLDVVKACVEALHGVVDVTFVPGHGTRFTLGVPLTLTTLRVLLVSAGGQTFAMPSTSVQKLLRVSRDGFRSVEGRQMLAAGGTPVPAVSLAETLGLRAVEPARPDGKVSVLIVSSGDRRAAFVADEFLLEQEVVVKSLGARIRRMRHVSAATILPSGRIALVLNTANLIRRALSRGSGTAVAPAAGRAGAVARKRILVVDDSVTTRTLEKSILEAAGYEVSVAADGQAAWLMLQERGTDLLVSDVDMPRMDGFALTEAVRGSKRFQSLPVVLVTARETDEDRARGVTVGANAYLGKSAFDQKNLLETIAQLL